MVTKPDGRSAAAKYKSDNQAFMLEWTSPAYKQQVTGYDWLAKQLNLSVQTMRVMFSQSGQYTVDITDQFFYSTRPHPQTGGQARVKVTKTGAPTLPEQLKGRVGRPRRTTNTRTIYEDEVGGPPDATPARQPYKRKIPAKPS